MLPTGTITFLFSDIEGSSRLWEKFPQDMGAAIAWHDAEWRKVVEQYNGYLVKTTGDGLYAVFSSAADAVNAIIAGQIATIAKSWPGFGILRIRIGMHTGKAEIREGDYFGPDVIRTSRLMSIASGGQILISGATASLLQGQLPDGATLLDLGEHSLRSLERLEHVYQLLHPELPADFPPLKSATKILNNLPKQLTSFIGRKHEIEQIKDFLVPVSSGETDISFNSKPRLITVTGAGGTGKTRLTLQTAYSMMEQYPDGVWWVELAPLADPQLVVSTTASSLGLREQPGRSLEIIMTDFLRPRRCLLVFDNCEHLIDECARVAEVLLQSCPMLFILATSREALAIDGEQIFPINPLSIPESVNGANYEGLSKYESIQLFVERAASNKPGFTLNQENAESILKICSRLDGIPLAIELAAARIRALSPMQIADRLDDQFRLLSGGSRSALPRQRTLMALIDWSYDLLSEPECILLRRLSVFSGGWTLEAAEVVAGTSPIETFEVLDLIEELVNKSLVLTETGESGLRYRFLGTIRQYALGKLEQSGEENEIWQHFVAYYKDLVQISSRMMSEMKGSSWIDQIIAEKDNLRTARGWALENDLRAALVLVSGLNMRLNFIFPAAEVLKFLETALGKAESDPRFTGPNASSENRRVFASALATASGACLRLGFNQRTVEYGLRGEEIARGENDLPTVSYAANMLSVAYSFLGDRELARRWKQESQDLALQTGDRWTAAMALVSWGRTLPTEEPAIDQEVWSKWERGMQMFRQGDDLWALAFGYQMAATTKLIEEKFDNAEIYAKRSLSLFTEVGDKQFANNPHSILAEIARKRGELDRATSMYQEIMGLWYDQGNYGAVARCMECLAFIAHAQALGLPNNARIQNLKDTTAILGAADAIRQAYNTPMTAFERPEYEAEIPAIEHFLGKDPFQAAWELGKNWDIDQAISFVLAM